MASIKIDDRLIETDNEPIEKLIELSDTLQNNLLRINHQLDKAKAHLHTTGEYADPDWYRRASYARNTQKARKYRKSKFDRPVFYDCSQRNVAR